VAGGGLLAVGPGLRGTGGPAAVKLNQRPTSGGKMPESKQKKLTKCSAQFHVSGTQTDAGLRGDFQRTKCGRAILVVFR